MAEAREYYNSNSREYAAKWAGIDTEDNPSFYFRRKIIKAVVDSNDIHSGQHVIEVGSGTGLVLRKILEKTKPVYGTDISEEMLRRAQDSVLKEYTVQIVPSFSHVDSLSGADVFLTIGDITRLNLPGGFFERIISMEVLRYVWDTDRSFQNIRRIMKPDSVFTFTVTNFFSSNLFPLKYTIRRFLGILKPTEIRQYFTTEGILRRQLRRNGFRVIRLERIRPISMCPLVLKFVKTQKQAEFWDRIDAAAAKIPLLRNLCDTFVVTVLKTESIQESRFD
jgi:ubiquinone/menaquinone biosynthesis C-methylase UbiE